MVLYTHQPIGATVELQYNYELRSSLCMYSITCGAWKSVLGNYGNSPRSNGPARQQLRLQNPWQSPQLSPLLIEYRVSVLCVFSLAAKASHPQSCVIFHPPFCTDTHVIWSEIHEEGAGRERRGIYMHSVRETRVFMPLHTCVFNVMPYITKLLHI